MTALIPFGPGIRTAEGPVVPFDGFPYPMRMAVIALSGGALFAWSPIALEEALRDAVDAPGRMAHLVSPNPLHHVHLGEWKRRIPMPCRMRRRD